MFLMSFLLGSFVCLFSVLPLRIRFCGKIPILLLIYAVAFKGQLQKLAGGPIFFAPDLPAWLIRSNSALYAGLFFFAFLLFLSLPVRIPFYLIRWKGRMTKENWQESRTGYNKLNWILLGTAFCLTAYSLLEGCSVPEVKVLTPAVKNLPAKAQGMKIVFLTDLHIDKVTSPERIRAIVEKSNALVPDLILLGGDLVDGRIRDAAPSVRELKNLKSRYGVYAVPGNHEYYSGYDRWKKFLEQQGIVFLENETERIPNGVYLSGLTDPAAKRYKKAMPDPEKVKADLPENAPAILLSHRPEGMEKVSDRYSLFLSGHTHGGMILGLDLLVGLLNDGYYAGEYNVNGMTLYISAGTAIWQGFPARLGHPAEITLVILRRDGESVSPERITHRLLFSLKKTLKKLKSML